MKELEIFEKAVKADLIKIIEDKEVTTEIKAEAIVLFIFTLMTANYQAVARNFRNAHFYYVLFFILGLSLGYLIAYI